MTSLQTTPNSVPWSSIVYQLNNVPFVRPSTLFIYFMGMMTSIFLFIEHSVYHKGK